MARTRPWEVSDAWWEKVKPLIPPAPSHVRGGRPRMDDRQAFAAMIYVLRTGIQWNALPRELGASSTVHDRFQEWERAGFFKTHGLAGLQEYDEGCGIEWEWQAVDGAMTKAPLGKAATGANPTDRGKSGTKRSLLTDGSGIPLALVVEGANRHDMKLLCATLDGIVVARPEPTLEQPQHLCLDAGYDYPIIREQVESRKSRPHIRGRGQEKQEKATTLGFRARRWVVERTHSWINRSRRLLVRWEKKEENYLSSFPWMEILSSGDRLLRRLKWSGAEQFSPILALMYRNGDSSSLAKELAWPSSRLLPHIEGSKRFPFFLFSIRLFFSPTQKRHILAHFTGSLKSGQQQ